jgi:hypothetical protein
MKSFAPGFGIGIGLLGAMLLLSREGGERPIPSIAEPMMSECDGRIQSVVIQYVAGADFAIPVYKQFLNALPSDIVVYAACPDSAASMELMSALGRCASRLTPLLMGHPMTAWSRDRWIALMPRYATGDTMLVASSAESGSEIWPARAGDQQIALDLCRRIQGLTFARSGMFFDGGDLLSDSRCVFVSPSAIRRNVQHSAESTEDFSRRLEELLNRKPLLLPNAPDHHVGMYMMAAGDNRVVIGDPSQAEPLFSPASFSGQADFSPQTQANFESVARVAAGAGYHVIRIPVVAGMDEKTYLSYVNGIIDQRNGHRTIYMPVYHGQYRLNAAATRVWKDLGYHVVPIDVTTAYSHFGTLHCMVNILAKSSDK